MPREQTILCFVGAAARRGFAAAGPREQTILSFGGAALAPRRCGGCIISAGRGHGLRGAGRTACAARAHVRGRASSGLAEAEPDDDGARCRRAHAAGGRADRAATGAPGVPVRAAAPPGQRGAVRGGWRTATARVRAGLRLIVAASWLGGAVAPPRGQTIAWSVGLGGRPRPLAGCRIQKVREAFESFAEWAPAPIPTSPPRPVL